MPETDVEMREPYAAACEWFAVGAEFSGSPFYAELLRRLAEDVRAGGPGYRALRLATVDPVEGAVPLRILGGVHLMVLRGQVPQLAAHYETVGGDGDATAAFAPFLEVLDGPAPEVVDALTRPPQPNEVGRSGALVPGLLTVARETGLPLRILEFGACAGLNLLVDHYWYEHDGVGWGDATSPVQFVDLWDGAPPFGEPAHIGERKGCDQDPIDATNPDEALTLLSYTWPGQPARFELLRAALSVASRVPLTIERADAAGWIERELATPATGRATVVFHSIVWQYLPVATRERIRRAITRAGEQATVDAPTAWLRLEPAEGGVPAELRLTAWDGSVTSGEERLLATSGFHGGTVHWR
jgi:hypothetical protein